MKSEKFIVLICTLYSVLCTPLWAHTSMLSIGVRGGGQTYLPDAALGASGEVKPAFGGTGTLDLRYTFYGCLTNRIGIGFAIGAGFGYGAAGIKGTNTDVYSNTDYLGNTIDYTINSDFTQRDRFAKIDLSLLFAMRLNGFTLNVGPRFMLPLAANRSLTINEANIDAYYPAYDVHVRDQLITGKLETPYTESRPSNISKYHLLVAAEIGYEWRFNRHALGVQLFAEAAVWSNQLPITNNQSPIISVSPITDASNPVPTVTVGDIAPMIKDLRYIDFGLRVYYAFSIESDKGYKSRFNTRDTRLHRNRYYWW